MMRLSAAPFYRFLQLLLPVRASLCTNDVIFASPALDLHLVGARLHLARTPQRHRA